MPRQRFQTAAAVLMLAAIASFAVKSRHATHASIMPVTMSGSVYTDKPCHLIISMEGKSLADQYVTFTHKIGPSARQVGISADSHTVTILDGLDRVLARQSYPTANNISWSIQNATCSSSGHWNLAQNERQSRTIVVTIKTSEIENAPAAETLTPSSAQVRLR